MALSNGRRTKGILILAVVFLLGMVSGAALLMIGLRTVLPHRPPGMSTRGPGGPPGLEHLAEELGLDPQQVERIETIMEDSRREVFALLEEHRHAVREILTPKQQERFDQMRPMFMRGRPGRRSPGGRPPGGRRPRQPPPRPDGGP